MRSISTVGVRSVRARRGRYVLTGMAIVLSVAVLFSVLVSAVSVNRGPDRFTADFTGRADVVATAMGTVDAAMAPDVVGLAQSLDGVDRAVGVAGFSAAVDVGEDDLELMAVQGVDIDEAGAIRRFELADGRYFAPDVAEVVLPLSQARRLDVGLGGTVAVSTPGGRRELTVAGILADDGAGRFQAAVSPTCRCRWPSA